MTFPFPKINKCIVIVCFIIGKFYYEIKLELTTKKYFLNCFQKSESKKYGFMIFKIRGLLFTSHWLNLQHWTGFYIAVYGNFQGLFFGFRGLFFALRGRNRLEPPCNFPLLQKQITPTHTSTLANLIMIIILKWRGKKKKYLKSTILHILEQLFLFLEGWVSFSYWFEGSRRTPHWGQFPTG